MTWLVEFDHGTAFITGPKAEARRRIEACGDHGPIWTHRRGAWATSPSTASRVIDQLEARRVAVTIEHADQVCLDLSETTPANQPSLRQESLW